MMWHPLGLERTQDSERHKVTDVYFGGKARYSRDGEATCGTVRVEKSCE